MALHGTRGMGPMVRKQARCLSGGMLDLEAIASQFNVPSGPPGGGRFDLAVIGGGSGGMACAKEAARLGKKVALFDYVTPSPHGSTWGLGGTCVNVGCIPKKLMHHASNLGQSIQDATTFGWNVDPSGTVQMDWTVMRQTVQNHIKSLNFGYTVGLDGPAGSTPVAYLNAKAHVVDNQTISFTGFSGETEQIHTDAIVVATGGRPSVPNIPGSEFAISSDDLFLLKDSPGKTLVVGGSYVALECAGFLTGMGLDVTVAIRSQALRGDGFDRLCVDKVLELMRFNGTHFRWGGQPTALERTTSSGRLSVSFSDSDETPEEFDTVMFATGRKPDVHGIGLLNVGVKLDEQGKVVVAHDQGEVQDERTASCAYETSAAGIYCIGDAAATNAPELTPVAIRQGEVLARELYDTSSTDLAKQAMRDVLMVPATVFTPTEYGRVGFSEEAASAHFGIDSIVTYLMEWQSLEVAATHRTKRGEDMPMECLVKLVCLRDEDERVVGLHYVGPHAGEVLQGMSIAVKMGARKQDFDWQALGIHPTDAEAVVGLDVTSCSGEDYKMAGGCGGGKCG